MKIAVVGSRDFKDYAALDRVLIEYLGIYDEGLENTEGDHTIISGGAIGADNLAEIFADDHNMAKFILLPNWDKYGKMAGLKRNGLIIAQADVVFAFWDGKSRGTKDTINKALKAKKETHIYFF